MDEGIFFFGEIRAVSIRNSSDLAGRAFSGGRDDAAPAATVRRLAALLSYTTSEMLWRGRRDAIKVRWPDLDSWAVEWAVQPWLER